MDRPNVTVVFQDAPRQQSPMGCAEAGISLAILGMIFSLATGIGLWSLAGLVWGAIFR